MFRGVTPETRHVNTDCKHYRTRSQPGGEVLEMCRLKANLELPFACPEGCLFYERKLVGRAGWHIGELPEPR